MPSRAVERREEYCTSQHSLKMQCLFLGGPCNYLIPEGLAIIRLGLLY
jgi:hypothetical protein